MPLGRPVDPSSSAGHGRWMSLRRGRPPGQASSGVPADLHSAPGPTRENDPPATASGPSAPDVEFGEDQRVTSLAPQVAWDELTAWWRAGFLVLGFGTNVTQFVDREEGGGNRRTFTLLK